jgi:oligoendopeptidase F
LKFKKGFWDLLWKKIREPKIREYYKPENLILNLKKMNIYDENIELFNNFLNSW